MKASKLWGGRFSQPVDPVLEKFNSSIEVDKVFWKADIEGSVAYALALKDIGILNEAECKKIVDGLFQVQIIWQNNKFNILESDEDIHTANERMLKEIIGPISGKLHTGRSRNDQVSTDFRLYIRKYMYPELKNKLLTLLEVIVVKSQQYVVDKDSDQNGSTETLIFPGYTHMQRAQPIAFSHWLLSYGWAFNRDLRKLVSAIQLEEHDINVLTLGSGALAGNPLAGFDRETLAARLGFDHVSQNSLDATANRDFVVDLLQWAAIVGIHLSKMAEDLILYSTKEFGFIKLSDAYTTGSSLMPQKKNADSLELIRGKSGRLIGNLTTFLTVLKGLPSSYNKDLQEDKAILFDSMDALSAMLAIMSGVVATFQVNAANLKAALSPDMLATDVAYYLVKKGMAFREAHHVVGSMVKLAEDKGTTLNKLTVEELKKISDLFEEDIGEMWDYQKSIEQYSCTGGTSTASVLRQIKLLQAFVNDQNKNPDPQ